MVLPSQNIGVKGYYWYHIFSFKLNSNTGIVDLSNTKCRGNIHSHNMAYIKVPSGTVVITLHVYQS